MGLSGHKRIHGQSGGKLKQYKICCIETKEEVLVKHFDSYLKSLIECLNCKKKFKPTRDRKYFCSQSCSASYNNRKRVLSHETREKISQSLKKHSPKFCKIYYSTCTNCKRFFVSKSPRKTCSDECCHSKLSKTAMQKILKGNGNFSTKVGLFEYKGFAVECDSKLEAAAVVYLVDRCGAKRVERFRSILTFRDTDGHVHRFNPDFFCTT